MVPILHSILSVKSVTLTCENFLFWTMLSSFTSACKMKKFNIDFLQNHGIFLYRHNCLQFFLWFLSRTKSNISGMISPQQKRVMHQLVRLRLGFCISNHGFLKAGLILWSIKSQCGFLLEVLPSWASLTCAVDWLNLKAVLYLMPFKGQTCCFQPCVLAFRVPFFQVWKTLSSAELISLSLIHTASSKS